MKKLITLIVVLLINTITFGQVPQKMSYQAVIRDASGNLVVSTSIGMQIIIINEDVPSPVYAETHTATTNANGLVTVPLGSGTATFGTFSSIDWSSGNYSVQVGTDITGGTSYDITGTSQFLSVPYAMYAGSAAGGLNDGSAAGVAPFWNGTTWVTNNTNFYNNGTNIGLYTTNPTAQLELADIYPAGGKNLQIGDDTYLSDIDVNNTLGIYGVQDSDRAGIKLGSGGATIWGQNDNIGIGTTDPTAKLEIAGTIKIADGTQGTGKILTSDANGLATWATPAAAVPYYDINSPQGIPSSAFPLGNYGTMVNFVFYNNCSEDQIFAGTMLISPVTGDVEILNYSTIGIGTMSMSSSGNVITLLNSCGTITITLNVSGSNCTITSGGPNGIFIQAKLTVIGI